MKEPTLLVAMSMKGQVFVHDKCDFFHAGQKVYGDCLTNHSDARNVIRGTVPINGREDFQTN